MMTHEPGTVQSEATRQRYETARDRLTGELGDRVHALVGIGPTDIVPVEGSYEQRAAVIEAGLELIVPLRRFVEGELLAWIDPELVERRAIEPDDIVANVYLEAVEQAGTAPVARAFYTWLRRIARREVRDAVLALDARMTRETSIYNTVVEVEEDWPAEISELIDLLADPDAPVPEDILVRQETQQVLGRVLARLPEQWRETFLMIVVDGWGRDEIAAVEGIAPDEVDNIVTKARQYLHLYITEKRIEV